MDIAQLGFDVSTIGLDRGISKLNDLGRAGERNTEKIDKSAKKTGLSFKGLTSTVNLLGGALAGLGIVAAANQAINAYRSFESMSAGLKSVTGSTEAASAAMSEILEFAKQTPYTLDQSIVGYQRLKSLGLDPSMAAMSSYGNTASAMGKSMLQMIEAVADASTGEFERLKEFGIKGKKEGENIKFTFQGVTTAIGNNATEIQKYLLAIGNDKFGDAMANQMNTINGAAANLEDAIFQLQVEFVKSTGMGEAYRQILLSISETISNQGMAAVESFSILIGDLTREFNFMSEVWGSSHSQMIDDSNEAYSIFGVTFDEYKQAAADAWDFYLDGARYAFTYAPIYLKASVKAMSFMLESWYRSGQATWYKFQSAAFRAMAFIENKTGGVFSSMVKLGSAAIQKISRFYGYLGNVVGEVTSKLKGVSFVNSLSETVDGAIGNMKRLVSEFIGAKAEIEKPGGETPSPDETAAFIALKQASVAAMNSAAMYDSLAASAKESAGAVMSNAKAIVADFESTRELDKALQDADRSFGGLTGGVRKAAEAIASKTAAATLDKQATVKLTDAQREALRIIEETRTPLEAHNERLKMLRGHLGKNGVTQEVYNRAVAAANKEYSEAIKVVSKLSDAQKRAAIILDETRTPHENYNAEIKQYQALLKSSHIDQDTYNRAIAAAKANLDSANEASEKAKKVTVELTQAQKDYNSAQASVNKSDVVNSIAIASIGKTDEAIRALTLSYENGYTEVMAKTQAANEFSTKSFNEKRSAIVAAGKAVKESAEAMSLSKETIGLTDQAIRALTLTGVKGYTKELAKEQAANEFSKKAYDEKREAIQKAIKAVADSTKAVSFATSAVGLSEEAYRSAALFASGGYSQSQADIQAANEFLSNSEDEKRKAINNSIKSLKDSEKALSLSEKAINMNAEQYRALSLELDSNYSPKAATAQARNESLAKSNNELRISTESAKKAYKDLGEELDRVIASVSLSDQATRELQLSGIDGYDDDLAKKQANREAEIKFYEKKREVIQSANKALIDSDLALKIVRESTGLSEQAARALNLEVGQGYPEAIANKIAANEADIASSVKAAAANKEYERSIKALANKTEILNIEMKEGSKASRVYEYELEDLSKAQAEAVVAAEDHALALDQLKSVSDSLADSLTNALLSGDYKSIGSQLVDTFKNDILGPILEGPMKEFSTAISNTMSGIGNKISGAMGGSSSMFGQSGGGIMSMISGGGLSGALGAGGLGMMFGQAIGQSGIGAGIGSAIGSALTGVLGPLGPIIGGGLGAIAENIFGGSKETTDAGAQFQYSGSGFVGYTYEDWKKDGGWFSSDKSGTNLASITGEVADQMNEYFGGIRENLTKQSFLLGTTSSEALLQSFETATKKISGEASEEQITAWAEGVTNEMYEHVYGSLFDKFMLSGEELSDTVGRLIIQLDSVLVGIDYMGYSLGPLGANAAKMADIMVQAAGSLDTLNQQMEAYYTATHSQNERDFIDKQKAIEKISIFNATLGLTGDAYIDNVAELRAYVESLDMTTESGALAAQQAFALAESIVTFSGAATDASFTLQDLTLDLEGLKTRAEEIGVALYGTIDERYQLELSNYNTLIAAAEALESTSNSFFASVTSESNSLAQAQRDYNSLLQQAQGGDASVVADLQAAAVELKNQLGNTFGAGSQDELGISQIAGQLEQVSANFRLTAGSEPVNPSDDVDLSAESRKALVDELLAGLQTIGLAEDISVKELIDQSGLNVATLASDFGVKIDELIAGNALISKDQIEQIVSLGSITGQDIGSLASEIGADIDNLGSSVIKEFVLSIADGANLTANETAKLQPYLTAIEASNDSASLKTAIGELNPLLEALSVSSADSGVSSAIISLKPLLSAIVNANDSTTLKSAITLTNNFLDSLPSDIKSQLQPSFEAITNASAVETSSIELLASLTSSEFAILGNAIGVDIESLIASNGSLSKEQLSGIATLSNSFNSGIGSIGDKIGLNISSLTESISETLSQGVNNASGITSDDIKGLEPFLTAIKESNDSSALDSSLQSLGLYLAVLPSSITDTLGPELALITRGTYAAGTAIYQLKNLNEYQLQALGDRFGINIQELIDNDIALSAETSAGLIALAKSLDSDVVSTGTSIGASFEAIKASIDTVIPTIQDIDTRYKASISAFLSEVKSADNVSELNDALVATSRFLQAIPEDQLTNINQEFKDLAKASYDAWFATLELGDDSYLVSGVKGVAGSNQDQFINIAGTESANDTAEQNYQDYLVSINGKDKLDRTAIEQLERTVAAIASTEVARDNLISSFGDNLGVVAQYMKDILSKDFNLRSDQDKDVLTQYFRDVYSGNLASLEATKQAILEGNEILVDLSTNMGFSSTGSALNDPDLAIKVKAYSVGTDSLGSDGLIMAHKGESIFTEDQSNGLRDNTVAAMENMANLQSSSGVIVDELRRERKEIQGLRAEIAGLRKEQKSSQFEIAKTNKRTSSTLETWTANGLPAEEVVS